MLDSGCRGVQRRYQIRIKVALCRGNANAVLDMLRQERENQCSGREPGPSRGLEAIGPEII
jgi:hypothetical protein